MNSGFKSNPFVFFSLRNTQYSIRSTKKAFALIELLVVISILVVLMAVLFPALRSARENAKRVVCLSNLKQLTLAWILYADENNNKLVNGQTGAGCWVTGYEKLDLARQIKDIKSGLLFPYCKNIDLYRCPTGEHDEMRTYSIVDAMNGHDAIRGAEGHVLKTRLQIKRPAERMVFVDEGRLTPTSWTVYYDQEKWWDVVPVRHAKGSDFSFADGHSEFWKWQDPRTLEWDWYAWLFSRDSYQPGNPDLHRVQRAFWGDLGYTPAEPP